MITNGKYKNSLYRNLEIKKLIGSGLFRQIKPKGINSHTIVKSVKRRNITCRGPGASVGDLGQNDIGDDTVARGVSTLTVVK